MDANDGKLISEVTGEIEFDDKVLMIKRIHAHYRLDLGETVDRDAVERVHGFHVEKCPVARSIRGSIEVTSSYEFV